MSFASASDTLVLSLGQFRISQPDLPSSSKFQHNLERVKAPSVVLRLQTPMTTDDIPSSPKD